MNESEIKDITVHKGKGEHGFKLVVKFEDNKILYFNSLWMHYFDLKDLKNKYNFKKIKIEAGYLKKIYCFEGVGFYMILSTGFIIKIYEEIINLEYSKYNYNYEIISNKAIHEYDEILKEIMELGESDNVIERPPKFW